MISSGVTAADGRAAEDFSTESGVETGFVPAGAAAFVTGFATASAAVFMSVLLQRTLQLLFQRPCPPDAAGSGSHLIEE